jgi:hypothetical protein
MGRSNACARQPQMIPHEPPPSIGVKFTKNIPKYSTNEYESGRRDVFMPSSKGRIDAQQV